MLYVRRSTEPLSQKALVHELRMRIDRARQADGTSHGARFRTDVFGRAAQSRRHVLALVDAHPIGAHSSHVRHNLGPVRREWLDAVARGRAPFQSEPAARSSAEEEGGVVRDNQGLKKAVDPKPPEEPKRFQRDQASIPVTIKGDAEPPKKGSER